MQLLTRVMSTASVRGYQMMDADMLLATIDSLERIVSDIPQVRQQAAQSRVGVYGSVGRMREAEEAVAGLRAANRGQALNSVMFLLISGLAPESAFTPERELLAVAAAQSGGNPSLPYWFALHAFARDDTANAARYIGVLEQDTSSESFVRPEMTAALRGWLTATRGDTAAAITQMRTAIRELGYAPSALGPTVPLRVQLGVLQVSREESRAEGLRRLELIQQQDPSMLAFIAVPLAEGYRAAGRIADARLVYSRFIALWRDADAELQPRVHAAEEALARLSADRGAT